jgi:hypothetical protein
LGKDPTPEQLASGLDQLNKGMTKEEFNANLRNSDASQQYQASNFPAYQVAKLSKNSGVQFMNDATVVPDSAKQYTAPRTALEANKSVPQDSFKLQEVFSPLEQQYGLPEGTLLPFSGIESTFGTNQQRKGSQFKGMFQLSRNLINGKEKGVDAVKNPYDWKENARAAAQYAKVNRDQFVKKFGHEPTAKDYYGMHQQGFTGYTRLYGDPNKSAAKAVGSVSFIKSNLPGDMAKQAKTISSRDFLRFLNDKFDKLSKGPDGKGLDTTGGTKPGGTPTPVPKDLSYLRGRPSEADLKSIADFLASQGIGVMNKDGATPGSSSGFIATEPNTRSLIEYLTRSGAGGNVGGGTGFTGTGGGTGAGTGSVVPSTSLGSQPLAGFQPLTFNQIRQIADQGLSMNQNANYLQQIITPPTGAYGSTPSPSHMQIASGSHVGGGYYAGHTGSGSSSGSMSGGVTFRDRGGRLAREHALKVANKAIYPSRKK